MLMHAVSVRHEPVGGWNSTVRARTCGPSILLGNQSWELKP